MHTQRLLTALTASAIVALLSGCATVTRGTKDSLVIETTPAGATVTVDGHVAQTPCSIKLSRKFEGEVVIEKPGFEPVIVNVTSSPSTAGGVGMAGNALIGGLIGAGLDVATGATNSLKPNPIQVTLVELGSGIQPTPVATEPEKEPEAVAPPPASVATSATEEQSALPESQSAPVSEPAG